MKISSFLKYNGNRDLESVVRYLTTDLNKALREMETLFNNLTFADNLRFFSQRVTIVGNSEVEIRNQLKSIPSIMLVANQSNADGIITKGNTDDSIDFLYVKNQTSATVEADILYFL